MNTAVLRQDSDYSEIQISGQQCFPANRWRDAILYYLHGVWGDHARVMYRPKIDFVNVTLRLDGAAGRYSAYGNTPGAPAPLLDAEQVLSVGFEQHEVESGLIRFVKNDQIRMLKISFADDAHLYFWKGLKRGELYCWSKGIPPYVIG